MGGGVETGSFICVLSFYPSEFKLCLIIACLCKMWGVGGGGWHTVCVCVWGGGGVGIQHVYTSPQLMGFECADDHGNHQGIN